MLEEYVRSTVLRMRLSRGLLAPHVDGFVSWQRGQGFKPITIECDLRALASWAEWIEERGFTGDCDLIHGFEKCKSELKTKGRIFYSRGPNKDSIKVAAKYIRFLRERGVLEPLPKKLSVSETWPLLAEFRLWSIEHRGLKITTLDLYETCLRDLMKELGTDPGLYKAEAIRKFILNRAKPHSVCRAQAITVATKSFLRYLSITGQCPISLVGSVPKYHNYEHKGLPRYLEPSEVEKVIRECRAQDENGLRDRAVILLLSRLGLRASDVAHLSFCDIDWSNGRIAVCGKNRTQEWLPLPQDVGDAILKYISDGRSHFKTERIFIKVDAPIGPLTRATVTHIARSAFKRAGVKAPVNGAHVFRHSAATAMLRSGVSLAGVRVSELVELPLEHLSLSQSSSVRIIGKGRRERCLPLWKETTKDLRAWLAVRGVVNATELFVNADKTAMTRSGFEYVLDKHVQAAALKMPSLKDRKITPHQLRHSCALVMLQATRDIRKVSLWLGHADLRTTELYLRVDPSKKLEAMEAVIPPSLRRGRFKAPDALIATLMAT